MRDDGQSYQQVGGIDDCDEESDASCDDEANADPTNSNAPDPINSNADGNCSLLRVGGALSILVGTFCLVASVYQRDERFQFIRERYHAGAAATSTSHGHQPPPGLDPHHGQGQYVQHSDGEVSAGLAYQTAPFDIPYARIECRPCSKASHLMNPLAPYAIIGGAMKGGTRALLTYLSQHPDVYSHQGKEMHMLDNSKIKVFASRDDPVCDQCKVLETYRQVYQDRKRSSMLPHEERDRDLIFFDKSPSYMVMSHITPQRVLCAFPRTAKVIFTLRNPVDRSYSHYQHCVLKYRHKTKNNECGGSFEEYIDKDFGSLLKAGVFNASSPIEEYETFLRYHHSKGNAKNFVLAKGLYSITLRHWIAVFRDHFGEDKWKDHLMILESERMREHKQEVFDEALEFLDMKPYELQTEEEYHVGSYDAMSDKMRARLEDLYRPFNAKLDEMLSPLGIEISWAK
jgi:hypothetical protein